MTKEKKEELSKEELEKEVKELLDNPIEYKLDESLETEYLRSKIKVLKYALDQKDEEFTQSWDSREASFQKQIDANLHEHQSIMAAVDELQKLAEENAKLRTAIGKMNELFAEADFEIQKRNLVLEDLGYDIAKLDVKLEDNVDLYIEEHEEQETSNFINEKQFVEEMEDIFTEADNLSEILTQVKCLMELRRIPEEEVDA
jgi:hypothetical protein